MFFLLIRRIRKENEFSPENRLFVLICVLISHLVTERKNLPQIKKLT